MDKYPDRFKGGDDSNELEDVYAGPMPDIEAVYAGPDPDIYQGVPVQPDGNNGFAKAAEAVENAVDNAISKMKSGK